MYRSLRPKSRQDYDSKYADSRPVNKNARFVAVAGIGLLSPGTASSHDITERRERRRSMEQKNRHIFQGGQPHL